MIDNDEIILPKGYCSWSQLEIFEKSPERYAREYFMDGRKLDTDALRFGKSIAKMIEDGEVSKVLPDLVVYDICEYKMFTDIKGIKCLSFIDSYDTATGNFREYKTGKVAWTQAKVQKHGQLLFYATMLKAITGKMPHHCHLDWIETENVEQVEQDGLGYQQPKLRLTGRITTFEREFDSREIMGMEERIYRNAVAISNAYKKYLSEQF